MYSGELSNVQKLKISCLSRGIRILKEAEGQLTNGGKIPLSIYEYTTTSGITLHLENDIYLNAPFNEWYCNPEASLTIDSITGQYAVLFMDESYPVRILPLPGYLNMLDSNGLFVHDVVMSHADRTRLSPINGCSFSCSFCNSTVNKKYRQRDIGQILEALEAACRDTCLPVKHILISGGTPAAIDYGYYDNVCEKIIRSINIPVDVMVCPRSDNIIDRLADWGVHGYAINIEIYDDEIARRLIPQKREFGLKLFVSAIECALQRTGGRGRVRSLVIVGLESAEKTLEGVEFLARLGCDQALSPFRPDPGTPLQNVPPPSVEVMERVYLESLEIVERFGVKLGPRCIPCQHNMLAFPDGSQDFYYS